MRRKFLWTSILFGAVVVTITLWYIWPKSYHHTFEGIRYQLGSENTEIEESVTVELDGEIQNRLFENRTYRGTIRIAGQKIPPENAGEVEIQFDIKDGGDGVKYTVMKDEGNYPTLYFLGTIFLNDQLDELALTIHDQRESGSSWSSKDGMMITAPAGSRSEALSTANKLMNEILQQPLE
ncbi:hypothetical protein GWK91_12245 [Virgibacillus sp. MSP4-1]|uniref:hypothetical protein n=1 Tax=Virgibacillus sp. MSP4-1 TaxID=2700081 RepID=UPI0005C64F0F|nr:hypothetical protein [Virgibacillus sp. MSP4-1]QHS23674.1 hypothetical protein GWK91_12245 [Virgibacillus sp. MSP4-1]